MAVSLLLLAVDYQILWVDPDPRNKKDDTRFLSQRTGLGNLVLGWQFFSTIFFFFFYLFIFLIEG